MDVGLPRETQQIDRVMEAFAKRYLECNRSMFISDGMSSCAVSIIAMFIVIRSPLYPRLQPYHAPYRCVQQIQQAKNDEGRLCPEYKTSRCLSRGPGSERKIDPALPLLISLPQYFYDNIVFAPFIFVEDPLEVNLQRTSDAGQSRVMSGIAPQHSLPGNGSSVNLLGKSNKIDPYYLIAKASHLQYCRALF